MSKTKSMSTEQGSIASGTKRTTKKFNLSTYKIPSGKVLILRSCKSDMSSYNGFIWPISGYVEAKDFNPVKECGQGLHGFLKGEGDGSLASFEVDSKWLVCEVDENLIIELNGKVKFKHCEVIFCGCQKDASQIMLQLYPGCKVIGGTATAGNRGTATAGYSGTATAGDSGTATAGDSGTATAGNSGTATAGYSGTATAGDSGILIIEWYDSINCCYKKKAALVGENGIKPNVKYKLDSDNNFKEVGS